MSENQKPAFEEIIELVELLKQSALQHGLNNGRKREKIRRVIRRAIKSIKDHGGE